jgi:hypothetical protein
LVPMATIETALRLTPTQHSIIEVQGAFTGYLQHFVKFQPNNVLLDMTETCTLAGAGF